MTSTIWKYNDARPIDRRFYARVGRALASHRKPVNEVDLPFEGTVLHLEAGEVVTVALRTGPQIVHLFAWNPLDSDERIWPHETSGMEDAFLRIGSRVWGTMPRYRPLLTMVEDTVVTTDQPRELVGRHHFVLGGFETRLAWEAAGGRNDVPSGWERMVALLANAGFDTSNYRDHISLFQKMAIEPTTQRLFNLASDARPGDHVSLFAEIPIAVAFVPSTYRGGGIPVPDCDGRTDEVMLRVQNTHIEPLAWPYPGVRYPDISRYIDAQGGVR